MALVRRKVVEKLTIRFDDGTIEDVHPEEDSTMFYTQHHNGSKLGSHPAKHWMEHEIRWVSDREEGVG